MSNRTIMNPITVVTETFSFSSPSLLNPRPPELQKIKPSWNHCLHPNPIDHLATGFTELLTGYDGLCLPNTCAGSFWELIGRCVSVDYGVVLCVKGDNWISPLVGLVLFWVSVAPPKSLVAWMRWWKGRLALTLLAALVSSCLPYYGLFCPLPCHSALEPGDWTKTSTNCEPK